MRTVLFILLLISFSSRSFAALEDFTTYTEVDPNSIITITTNTITIDYPVTTAHYVYKDFGTNHFGDFTHLYDMRTATQGNNLTSGWWALNNGETTAADMATANKGMFFFYSRGTDGFYIKDYTNDNQDAQLGTFNATNRYLTITRSGTTLTVEIYTDSARTALSDTLSITCGTDQYSHFFPTMNSSDSSNTTATVGDVDLQQAGGGGSNPTASPTHIFNDFYGEDIYVN